MFLQPYSFVCNIDFHYCLSRFDIWAPKLRPWCLVINSSSMAWPVLSSGYSWSAIATLGSRSGFFFLELFDRLACFFDQLITWCVISFLITHYHLSMLLRLVHFIFFTRIQDRYNEFGTAQTKNMPLSKSNFTKLISQWQWIHRGCWHEGQCHGTVHFPCAHEACVALWLVFHQNQGICALIYVHTKDLSLAGKLQLKLSWI